jgi:hypothetical protein
MITDAARAHQGKGPPPSRQCACCGITYSHAALTRKSRKLTRAVPLCAKCCKAGGRVIYERLATSAKFIEAFKMENPTLAQQLLAQQEAEALRKQAKEQKKRAVNNAAPASISLQTKAQSQSRELSQHVNHLRQPPAKQLVPKMARKSISATRLLFRAPVNGAASTNAEGMSGLERERKERPSSQDPQK